MGKLQTYGKSIVWKPDFESNTAKVISSSGREVFKLSLKASGGAGVVSFYDAKTAGDANYTNLKWVLDASTQDSDNELFPNPLGFKDGIYAVLEQGANLNPIVCIEYYPDQI